MTDRYGHLIGTLDRLRSTPIGGMGRAVYEYVTSPHTERRKYGGYFLVGMGLATGFLPFSIAGAWLLGTIKPDGLGGFRNSTTYGFSQVNNALYEGMPRRLVFGKHIVFPSYVNAYTEQDGNIQTLKAVLYVSEGWDYGIESIDDIRLNGQPLSHFSDATVTKRLGASTDTAVKGFDKVAFHYDVGAEMKKGDWITLNTHQEVDEIAICLAWNGIFHTKQSGSSAGSMEKATWRCAVQTRTWNESTQSWGWWVTEYPADDDPDWKQKKGDWATSGKTRGIFRKILRLKFTNTNLRQYRIKATVANDDATQRRAIFQRVEEIVEESPDYSGIAYFTLEAPISGMLADGLPAISCEVEGLKLSLMNGTTAFTRNHAEVLRAMMTNSSDGFGAWVAATDIADGTGETFQVARDYFAENAASSGDHKEARFYCDLVIDVQQNGLDWLTHILSLCRSQLVEWDGQIQMLTDKAVSLDRTFDGRVQDTITDRPIPALGDGTPDINEAQLPSDEKISHFRVGYFDAADLYKPAWTEELIDPDWSSGDPVVRNEVSLPGITRETEALRQGRFILNNSRLRDKVYDWGLGPGDPDMVPMDMVRIKTTNPDLSALDVQVLTVERDQFGLGRATGLIYDSAVYSDTTDPKASKALVTRQQAEKDALPKKVKTTKPPKDVRVTIKGSRR